MKKYFQLFILVLLMFSCKKKESIVNIEAKTNFKTTSVEEKIMNLKDSNNSHVMVVSHRGDWRNAPENSIEAIQNCIKMGVDVVEIDVRKTKDKKLVIIHDARLDRTTTGKGLVSDWTLDSLQTIYLKNGVGHKSKHKIPTLKEALLTAKGHILINLDKCYDYFDEAYKVIKETGTEKQVIIKGFNKTVEDVKEELGARLDSIIFMPVVHLEKQNNPLSIIEDYQKKIKPVAIEIVFSKDTSIVLNRFSKIKENGSRVWVNSLWESLNAGYEDDVAVKHTDSIYGWYVKKGINMIQTDRPELLLKYLRSHGLHD